jgi:glycine/D-amino acid oxidase-like deaminating enzyme
MTLPSSTAIVVGAGVNGASTAFWLADKGVQVTLLEQGHPASGPTGSSSALSHAFYLERELSLLGDRGIQIMLDMEEITGGPADYRPVGMLWAVGEDQAGLWGEAVTRMQGDGIRIETLDQAALQEMAPTFDLHGVTLGVWEPQGGYADPVTTTTSMAKGVTRKGGVLRSGARVREVLHDRGRVSGVLLENGEELHADVVVLATGPWTKALVAPLGLDLPLTIERHAMAVLDTPGRAKEIMPWSWCDDVYANYARPEGEDIVLAGTWAGGGTGVRDESAERGVELSSPADPFKRAVDEAESASILATFEKRIPTIADLDIRKGYADLYDMSPDDLPLIGGLPGVDGLVVIAGSSGHGFKTGPAVGEAVADLVINGCHDLLKIFDPARFFGQ